MTATFQGQKVEIVRKDEDAGQVTIRMQDGSEKTVPKNQVTEDSSANQGQDQGQGRPQRG